MWQNLGDKFYFVDEYEEELFLGSVTVNENNRYYFDFSKWEASPVEAIQKYKLELFEQLDNKLSQLNKLEKEQSSCV